MVKTGQVVTRIFTTTNPTTGAAANAASTPVGTLYVNGTSNGATVTVTNVTTGVYKASVTLPALSAGDSVDLRIACTVNAIAGEGIIWNDNADTKYVSEVASDVWNVTTRSLTTFGSLVADIWNSTTRTLSEFAFGVTVNTNNDKSGYSGTATNAATALDVANSEGVITLAIANKDVTPATDLTGIATTLDVTTSEGIITTAIANSSPVIDLSGIPAAILGAYIDPWDQGSANTLELVLEEIRQYSISGARDQMAGYYDDGYPAGTLGELLTRLSPVESNIVNQISDIVASVPSGGGATDPAAIVDEVMKVLKASDSIKMGQGVGATIVDTSTTDFAVLRVTKDGVRGIKDVIVRAFPIYGTAVDWNDMQGRHVTDQSGNWKMYLDEGNYVVSFERNGVQLKTDSLKVGYPAVDIWGQWPPTNAVYWIDPDVRTGSSWKYNEWGNPPVLRDLRIADPFGNGYAFRSSDDGSECHQTIDDVPVRATFKLNHMYEVLFRYGIDRPGGAGQDEFSISLVDSVGENGGYDEWVCSFSDWMGSSYGQGYFDTRAIISPEGFPFNSVDEVLSMWDRESRTIELNGIVTMDLDAYAEGVMKRFCLKELSSYDAQPILGFVSADGDPGIGNWNGTSVVLDGNPIQILVTETIGEATRVDRSRTKVHMAFTVGNPNPDTVQLRYSSDGESRSQWLSLQADGTYHFSESIYGMSDFILESVTYDDGTGQVPIEAEIVFCMWYLATEGT